MGRIRSRYDQMYAAGFISLNRGRDCAKLTIPSILPPEGFNETMELEKPWQGIGAYSVNNLASKLSLVLFPPGGTFFRLTMSDFDFKKMMLDSKVVDPVAQDAIKNDMLLAFSVVERAVMTFFETNGWRAALTMAIKQLIVVNSCLLYMRPGSAKLRTLRRDRWVCKRNLDGEIVEIVTKEGTTWEELPEHTRQLLTNAGAEPVGKEGGTRADDGINSVGDLSTSFASNGSMLASSFDPTNIDIYTRVAIGKDGRYHVSQEIRDVDLGVTDIYSRETLPWIVCSWDLMTGEDYGRSLVEHHIGDFRSLEALSQCLIEYSAAAAKMVPMVNPNGVTCMDDLAGAANGQFIPGKADDVTFMKTDKYFDLKIPYDILQELIQRISKAFIVNSSLQRQAERVTAEEIRSMANELEDALGGNYSQLAVTMQLPLARLILAELQKEPDFPKISMLQKVKPMVIAGVEGLGKTQELQRLGSALGMLATFPEAMQMLDFQNIWSRIFSLSNVDKQGLIKSKQQIQQEQQQALQQQQQLAATPNLAKGAMDAHMLRQQQAEEKGSRQNEQAAPGTNY